MGIKYANSDRRTVRGARKECSDEVVEQGTNGFITSANTRKIESAAVTETTSGTTKQRMVKQKSQLRQTEVTYAFTLPGIKIVKLF